MKKLLAMLLVGTMACGLVACGGKDKPEEPPVVEAPVEEEVTEDEVVDEGDIVDPEIALSETEQIITDMYKHVPLEFPVITMMLDSANSEDPEYFKSYTGLATDENVEQAAVSEALISSQAYSLVVVKVAEDADAAAMATEMIEGVNPAKWVCVEADDVKVVSEGRYICLVMISSEYAEMATAEDLTTAFSKVLSGDVPVVEEVEGEAVEGGVEVEAEAETENVETEEVVDADAGTPAAPTEGPVEE